MGQLIALLRFSVRMRVPITVGVFDIALIALFCWRRGEATFAASALAGWFAAQVYRLMFWVLREDYREWRAQRVTVAPADEGDSDGH